MPPTTSSGSAIRVGPIGPGDEADFWELFRHHPGVGAAEPMRRVLRSAAADPAGYDTTFLLARRGAEAVGALAARHQPGRLGLYLPIIGPGGASRGEVLDAVAHQLRELADRLGLPLLECEFMLADGEEQRDADVARLGLSHVTDRLLLRLPIPGLAGGDPEALESAPYPRLVELAHAIYRSSGDPALDSALAGHDLDLMLESPGTRGWVLRGQPALSILRLERARGDIVLLGVVPEARRRGLGRAVLDASLAHLVKRGARAAHLAVSVDNIAARALYDRAGFIAEGRCRLFRLVRSPPTRPVDKLSAPPRRPA